MRFHRAQGFLATAFVGVLALGACDDPVQRTDLRPEGPPDVLTVLVMDDAIGFLYETATYCHANDDKAPTLVAASDFSTLTICPAAGPVTGAVPGAWYARVMFDELLDPDVEELIPVDPMDPDTVYAGSLLRTQPVTLTCGGAPVPYDGYYAPNGNNVTWPLGPSLVIIPSEFVATSESCSITLKDTITDKDGNAVPMDQRGPFDFSVAPLEIIATDPAPGGAEVSTDAAVVISFNAPLDDTTVDAADVVVETAAGAPVAGAIVIVDGSDIVVLGPLVDDAGTPGDPSDDFPIWAADDYVVTVPTGATFADIRGGTLTTTEDLVIEFTVL